MAKLNEKFSLAVSDVLSTPGPLADSPRQVVSFEKLKQRLTDNKHHRKPFTGHFLIADGVEQITMFGRLAQACIQHGLRTLIVEPRIGLTSQTRRHLQDNINPELSTLFISGANPNGKISNQELVIMTNQGLMQKFGQEEGYDNFDVVIYDQAHNILGRRNQEVLTALRKQAIVLGFAPSDTEHPIKSLRHLFGEPIDEISVAEASEAGLLCPIKTVVLKTNQRIGLDQIQVGSDGDYSPGQLSRAINRRMRNLLAIQFYANYHDQETGYSPFGQTGFVYCADIAHAVSVSKLFNDKLHGAFAFIHQAPDRLRDPRFTPLMSKDTALEQKEADDLQYMLIQEILGAYSRGDTIAPIPCAFVHGRMTGRQQQYIHRAHDLGLVKLLSNAQLLREIPARASASLILNLSPTKSPTVNSARGTKGDKVDENNPDKISMVVDFVDKDYALMPPSPLMGARNNRPRLFVEVLGGKEMVAPATINTRIVESQQRNPTATAFTYNDPELKLDPDQIMRPAEVMRSVSIGFRAPLSQERSTYSLTEEEIAWVQERLKSCGYSMAAFEHHAFQQNPFTLITATTIYRATHPKSSAPIDTKIWEETAQLLQTLGPRERITISYDQMLATRIAFLEAGLGELSSEYVCRLLSSHRDAVIDRRLFHPDYLGDIQISPHVWEEVQEIAGRLKEPEVVELIEYHMNGPEGILANPTAAQVHNMRNNGIPLDEHGQDAVALALKTLFHPLGLNFRSKESSINQTFLGIARIENIVRAAIRDQGEAYCINAHDFVSIAENWRNAQYGNTAYLTGHLYDAKRGIEWALPNQEAWQETSQELAAIMQAQLNNEPLSLRARGIASSREYTEMLIAASTNARILPSLQMAAMYLYDLTPTYAVPQGKAQPFNILIS